jgi:hypothetical protein
MSWVWSGKAALAHDKGPFLLVALVALLFMLLMTVLASGMLVTLTFTSISAIIVGALVLALVLALRLYGLAAVMVVVAHIYVDWYLGYAIVGDTIAIGLLLLLGMVRSARYPWVTPRGLWLWGVFLALGIFPVVQGAQGRYDLAYYYPNIILGALVMFWLGLLLARDGRQLRTLFQLLAAVGALLAVHTIIQARTGIVIFGTARFDAYLAQVSNFGLANSTILRAGSLFENPDWNGTFFAVICFVPFGLFAQSASLFKKLLYLSEMLVILVALLFTYSAGAWIGALAGMVVFVLLTGHRVYRLLVPPLVIMIGVVMLTVFPLEINLLVQHAANPAGLLLRRGAWQTAMNIIAAYPLTGIGLGMKNYLQRAEAYRVPAEYTPLAHPHNSYLELGAMAGLPVLLVFLALLLFALWQAWRNWKQADAGMRCLLGGGIAAIVALSVNSLSINAWTLPPIATIGWLVLGSIASPLITRAENRRDDNVNTL